MSAASLLTPHLSPVITIDGPSASGKGTVAERVAVALGFHFLDSGALYRLTALSAMKQGVALDDAARVAELAADLPATFRDGSVWLAGENVTDAIRAETVGEGASKVAALPAVRAALLDRQRAYRQAPGLVADGRRPSPSLANPRREFRRRLPQCHPRRRSGAVRQRRSGPEPPALNRTGPELLPGLLRRRDT